MQILRYLFAAACAIFVLGIATQVFLAGMFLFADGSRESHIDFGYTLTLVPIVLVLLALLARPGLRIVGLTVLLLALTWLQPILAWAREDVPFIAALHPVNAMLLFGLAILIARRAYAVARGSARSGAAAETLTTGA